MKRTSGGVVLVVVFVAASFAQTTNYIEAHPSFRVVRGKLYNSDKSIAWVNESGSVLAVTNRLAIVRTQIAREEEVAPAKRAVPSQLGRSGALAPPLRPFRPAVKKMVYEDGPMIAVTNLQEEDLVVDRRVDFRVLQVGRYEFNGTSIALYDRGVRHRLPIGVSK